MILNKSVIIFGKNGKADILITPSIGTETGKGKILFDQYEKNIEIGSQIKNRDINEYPHPIEFVFEDIRSIDTLIKSLETCKKEMINFKKENNYGK